MSQPPSPLTPEGCDMGRNDWFPLYFDRLRQSRWWRRSSDLARSRNIMLWGEAYKTVPAGSLADDDDALAEAAGFGFDVEAFLVHKAEIMAPWVMCSDGRWYHPTLCEVVLEAWERVSERRKAERIKKANQRATVRGRMAGVTPTLAAVPEETGRVPGDNEHVPGDTTDVPRDTPRNEAGHVAQDRTGQDRTLGSDEPCASAAPDASVEVVSARAKPSKAKPTEAEVAAFDAFWSVFPLKKGKAPALATFVRLRRAGEDIAAIMAGAQAYARERRGQDPTKTKYAQGWLNDRRWEDEQAGPGVAQIGADWSVETWREVVVRCRTAGRWDDRLGPPPGKPGCRVPPEALTTSTDGDPA